MTKMTKRLCAPVLFGALFMTGLPMIAIADSRAEIVEVQGLDEGGRARIDVGGKMNVLGQKAAAASCMIGAGLEVAHETKLLAASQTAFNRFMAALEYGDPDLGIPTAETYSKVVVILRDVHAQWDPMNVAMTRVLDGTETPDDMKLIATNNPELLKLTEILSSTLISEYANPFDLPLKDAMAISFAERQQMFAEKLLREACDIHTGNGSADLVADFNNTIVMFGQTLVALKDGYPAAGLNPPPTEDIKANLMLAQSVWDAILPLLTRIGSSQSASAEDVIAVSVAGEALDDIMGNAVAGYLSVTSPAF